MPISSSKIKDTVQWAITACRVNKKWNTSTPFVQVLPTNDGKVIFMPPDDKNKKFRYGVQSSRLGIWEGFLTVFKDTPTITIGSPNLIMGAEGIQKLFSSTAPTAPVPAPEATEEPPVKFEDIAWTEA